VTADSQEDLFDSLFSDMDMEEVHRRSLFPYEEQCVRELIRAMGEDNAYVRELFEAREAGRRLELQLVNELFRIPFGLVVGDPAAVDVKVISLWEVFKKVKGEPKIVELYYAAKAEISRVAELTAVFVKTKDAGHLVIHDHAIMGSKDLRDRAVRLSLPGREDHTLVVERRTTFLKALAIMNFV